MAKKRKKASGPGFFKGLFLVIGFPFVVVWRILRLILRFLGFLFSSLMRSLFGRRYVDVSQLDGYEYEEYVAQRLKKLGFRDIDLTPKSGDFGADIIARDRQGAFVCFQCKNYSRPVGPKAVQEVYAAIQHYDCDYGVVVASGGYTDSAVTLAEDCGVQLWEGI